LPFTPYFLLVLVRGELRGNLLNAGG